MKAQYVSGARLDEASVTWEDNPSALLPLDLSQQGSQGSLSLESTLRDQRRSSDGSMSDTVDTRKFKKGAKIFMRGGLAVEKTILNVWSTKTSNESRENSSLASESLGAISVGPGFYRTSQFQSLSSEERLAVRSWEVFKAFSVMQGDKPMDGGRGIPVVSLMPALREISKTSPTEIAAITQRRQYPSNAILSYNEFRSLVFFVFPPNPPSEPSAAGAAAGAAGAPAGGTPSNSQLQGTRSPIRRDSRDASAYHRLLQKQRGAASVVIASLPPAVTTDIGTHESLTDLEGYRVPTNKVKDAMLSVFKNEKRQRKIMLHTALRGEDEAMARTAEVALKASIYEPLLKYKVYGMAHGNETYAAKWERMKAKRDERVEREIQRAARQETIESVSRFVLTSEKRAIKQALGMRSESEKELARERVVTKITEEQETAERIFQREQEAREKRKQDATVLRAALEEASTMSLTLQEEELAEKKANVVPFVLNPASSALVVVPEEFKVRVKKARSLETYNAAKRAEKQFWEQTLDNRIKRFAHAKYEKMFKAADIGVRVAVTPLYTPLGPPAPLSSPSPSSSSRQPLFSRSMRDSPPASGYASDRQHQQLDREQEQEQEQEQASATDDAELEQLAMAEYLQQVVSQRGGSDSPVSVTGGEGENNV